MGGTYALQSQDGTYMLSREELERLAGWPGIIACTVTNAVTRKSVRVSSRRPLQAADIARISNDGAA